MTQTITAPDTLSTGAKIGIGLGATFIFLLCCCLLLILFFRYGKRGPRSKNPSPKEKPPIVTNEMDQSPGEIDSRVELWAPDGDYLLPELDIRPAAELEGRPISGLVTTQKGRRRELDGVKRIMNWG